MSRKPIRLYHTDRYALSTCLKSKNQKKGTKYCSVLGNQQNWFAKYINKKAYSTFSQPIGKLFDVVFSRTTIDAKLQNLMSSTFKYSFTNAQDFCARKGNKISLSYYWIISIYMVQKCWYICGWNAFAIFTKGHPFPLALIHMISSRLRPFFVWRSAKIFIALSHSVS